MAKTWVDRFIEWGKGRAEDPWTEGTATGYMQVLDTLGRFRRKRLEDFDEEDLREYQARQRMKEKERTWNRRVSIIQNFFQFLRAQGRRDEDPSIVLNRRPEPRSEAPTVDVLAALPEMRAEEDQRIALFLYFSALSVGEACSIREPPVGDKVHVKLRRKGWEWVTLSEPALDSLSQLGGRMPWGVRALERHVKPLTPREIQRAAVRDHQLRTSHGEAIAPVLALLASRPGLAKVARDYRSAVEEVQDPKGKPDDAITDAAGALQAMLKAMGAKGNTLGSLFDSARSKGRLGPYDGKLATAVEALVDWVSADRSGRGDAHGGGPAVRADAWLAVRIVGALLIRLEVMAPDLALEK